MSTSTAPHTESNANRYDIVAVTACPTGIAHTYMAAEALTKQAEKMGVTIKVETQGSAGTKSVLTAEDIAGAKGVIIAADKNVDLARFAGKPLYACPVARGIKEPEALIQTILDGKAPVQGGAASAAAAGEASALSGETGTTSAANASAADAASATVSATAEKESLGRKSYKDLMNGFSYVLPFVIAGGVLSALAYLLDASAQGSVAQGLSTPVPAFFLIMASEIFGVLLPVLAGFIAASIADRPALAPGFLGGLFAKGGYTIAYLSTLDYASLVSGGFIAAIAAGFIAGYLTLALEKLCAKLPASIDGIKPMLIYPVFATIATGLVMLVLNPVFSVVTMALCTFLGSLGTPGLVVLGVVLGAMMSVDMGGPCNKAAYVFGTAVLDPSVGLGTTGQVIMASVMAGGMIPPLVVALSTTLFKNRWTADERTMGLGNYLMGLCFVSEGAIPFASKDPKHVMPGFIIGSAVAAGLSAAFGCASPTPHGGAWVSFLVGNGAQWLLACLIGALVGCLILSFSKPALDSHK